jgi:nitroreductase
LTSLFEAARLAPSSYNEQPWRFIYAGKGSEAYDRILQSVYPANQSWAKSAPVLIVTVLSKFIERNGTPNKYAWYDLGQSVGNLTIQATAAGLKMRQMGGFDSGKLKELFKINEEYEPATVIALGYPGKVENLEPALLQRERSARSRKPFEEIIFKDDWKAELGVLDPMF